MNIDEIIAHWMPHDFKKAIHPPATIDEAKNIVNTHPEVSCLAITKERNHYTFNELLCAKKTCLNRSINVFNNIKEIIVNAHSDVKNKRFLFHFKGDACNIQQSEFALLSNSRSPDNNDVVLWPLSVKKNVIFHDEIYKYLKNPDTVAWEDKKQQFIFRGMNSGNPFSCVQYVWNKDRASRCDLLLTYLKLPEHLRAMMDVGFNRLYPNHLKLYFYKNKIDYLESQFSNKLKAGKSIYDLRDELKIIFQYIKPAVKMKMLFNYKYIFCPEGFDCSSALCWVLASNSLAIVPPFHYENSIISSKHLKPYVHFLPIKEDYSDLSDVMQWAIDNDEKCKAMVKNANEYMRHFISQDSMRLVQQTIIERLIT